MSVLRYTSLKEELAACFFFKNYVLENQLISSTNFGYLKDDCRRDNVSTSLADVIVAIGNAGLAEFYKEPNCMVDANNKYSSALNSVNLLLHDSASAKTDQTLITELLLAMYERNTCLSMREMANSKNHINGAETLLELRGKRQLETVLGRDLFAQVITQLITRCWQTHSSVPQKITEWSEVACQYESEEEVAVTRLSKITSQLCSLRMISVNNSDSSSPNDFFDSGYLIASALEIDNELADWVAKCPCHTTIEPLPRKKNAKIFTLTLIISTTIFLLPLFGMNTVLCGY